MMSKGSKRVTKKVTKNVDKNAKAGRSAGKGGSRREAKSLFMEAIDRAAGGFLFDAIGLFRAAIKADPKSDFADDALFDIGHCYLRMQLLNDAERTFTELLQKYPDAKIYNVAGGSETGRTAAKALLGRARARLKLGDLDGAKADVRALAEYTDSSVEDMDGKRRSFHELGRELLATA